MLNLSIHPHFSFSTQAPLSKTKSSGHLHSPGMIGGSLRHISLVCSSFGSRQVLRHFTSSFGGSQIILGSGQIQAAIEWSKNYNVHKLEFYINCVTSSHENINLINVYKTNKVRVLKLPLTNVQFFSPKGLRRRSEFSADGGQRQDSNFCRDVTAGGDCVELAQPLECFRHKLPLITVILRFQTSPA